MQLSFFFLKKNKDLFKVYLKKIKGFAHNLKKPNSVSLFTKQKYASVIIKRGIQHLDLQRVAPRHLDAIGVA